MSPSFKQQLGIFTVWLSAAVLVLAHLLADPQASRAFTFVVLAAVATLIWMTHRLASASNPNSAEQDDLIEELKKVRQELTIVENERTRAETQRDWHEQEREVLERHNKAVVAIRQTLDATPDTDITTEDDSLDDETDDAAAVADAGHALDDALRSVGDDVATRAGTEVEVNISQDIGLARATFDDGEHALLLRIAEEAAGNIVKHADASRVIIDLTMDDGSAVLRVEDDGIGFDAAGQLASIEADEGLLSTEDGLGYIMEQVIDLDGTFQIGSTPGEGTTIVARLPINDS